MKHLDEKDAKRITKDLRKTLSENPKRCEHISGQFKGTFKQSIDDYYVIYSKTRMVALILRIRHRGSAQTVLRTIGLIGTSSLDLTKVYEGFMMIGQICSNFSARIAHRSLLILMAQADDSTKLIYIKGA